LVECGKPNEAIQLRLIRVRKGKKLYEGLTNLLDRARLSAADVVALYPKRWNIERLFYDLKVVLNLKRFYAANPNAVAMQVYAAVMVHAAFRFAQGKIAADAEIPPEGLLQYLSVSLGSHVWKHFNSWLRTMDPNRSPSEMVVGQALRSSLPHFLATMHGEHELEKMLVNNAHLSRLPRLSLSA
jgi:hypothetical protein